MNEVALVEHHERDLRECFRLYRLQHETALGRGDDYLRKLEDVGEGDLVVEIVVETPTKLTKAQREILEQFRATETGDECPESRGFLDRLKEAFGG